jgi:hypothetical protein
LLSFGSPPRAARRPRPSRPPFGGTDTERSWQRSAGERTLTPARMGRLGGRRMDSGPGWAHGGSP